MSASTDPRASWRASPVAYRDESLGLVLYKPKKPGSTGADGAWRLVFVDPTSGRRRGRKLRGTRDEVIRAVKRLASDLEKRRAPDWADLLFVSVAMAYLAVDRDSRLGAALGGEVAAADARPYSKGGLRPGQAVGRGHR